MAVGNYEEAITEYTRFIFFNPGDESAAEAYYQMGLAFRNQKKWPQAIDAFKESITAASDDSIGEERRISIAVTHIASGQYSVAEFELLRIGHFTQHQTLRRKANYFLGICYLYTSQWGKCSKAFQDYFVDAQTEQKIVLDSLLWAAQELPYKSPKVAKWLSTFLPGSGQIYCGDWRNGINAFALNSLTSYILMDALLERRFRDASISHLTLFHRYYQGNRYNAERIAILNNERLNQSLSKKILQHLCQIEAMSTQQ